MLDSTAVLAGVVFGGFAGMVRSMKPVPVSDMRMVRGFFVITLFVVSSGFAVVGRRMLVMFSSFSVMICSFVVHPNILFRGEMCGRRRESPFPRSGPMEFYQGLVQLDEILTEAGRKHTNTYISAAKSGLKARRRGRTPERRRLAMTLS